MNATEFAATAHRLQISCAKEGLTAPAFMVRNGPRGLRWLDGEHCVVYIPPLAGRPDFDVCGDMADGVLAINGRAINGRADEPGLRNVLIYDIIPEKD